MIMSVHCPCTLVVVVDIPEFDGEIGRAGCYFGRGGGTRWDDNMRMVRVRCANGSIREWHRLR